MSWYPESGVAVDVLVRELPLQASSFLLVPSEGITASYRAMTSPETTLLFPAVLQQKSKTEKKLWGF